MSKVLVIENTRNIQALLKQRFRGKRISVDSMRLIDGAMEKIATSGYDVLIWDAVASKTEQSKGLELLDLLTKDPSKTYIIVVMDQESGSLPPDRLKAYAHRALTRPFDGDEICALITQAIHQQASSAGASASRQMPIPLEFEGIFAVGLPMRTVIQRVQEAASVDIPVLITGETGTGKDLVAAAIHKRSKRKNHPYLPINMGAIPSEIVASELFGHERGAYTGASEARRGLFEQAQGGTIFLDEITTMNEKTQVSLLRVLETSTLRRVGGNKDIDIDIRIIAATNENIEETVKEKRFREDLYYRLDVFRIHISPLRERPGGRTFLTDHFIAHFDAMYKKNIRVVSPETYRLLRRYPWPGNVRELKNVIQRAVLMANGPELTPDLLPVRIREAGESRREEVPPKPPIHLGLSLEAVERELITLTLSSVAGNKAKAASILRISRRALYNKLKRHGLL
jgi:DNA-binding NtrC family response regulator